ncbi:MAG TPA: hypothetical protein VN715_22430 [Roseiarcus sp.]|nr:hypothetical protein [Roseiarcus sp.]
MIADASLRATGGFKQLGTGRETRKYGIGESVQIKSTLFELRERARWVA